MTHRHYADPIWAPFRNAVAARWARRQQSFERCWSCWRSLMNCRCGGGD